MKSSTDVPGVYPPSGGYAHGIVVEKPSRWLFTSGTMGLDREWRAAPTIEGQLDLIWDNIGRILRESDFFVDDIVHLTCMLSDPEHSRPNAHAIAAALNGRDVPRTVFCVRLLDSSWLAEIQVVAAQRESGHAD